jgi:ABC transporter substrate binding protein/SAM domain (Sterile alpha motif)
MQQIADWLKKLGMSEYAERFAQNRIDLSVLPDLTDQHLEKLGVGLKETGFVEGRDISIEFRWADGAYDRLPSLAAELVGRNVSVITACDLPSAFAAKAATKTIPIVFGIGADPIKVGLVESLSRPNGNLTGVSIFLADAPSVHGQIAGDLPHPWFVRMGRDAGDVDAAALQVNEEQHIVRDQASKRHNLDCEEVGCHEESEVGPNKFSPGGRTFAHRRWRYTVTPQNIADGLMGDLTSVPTLIE